MLMGNQPRQPRCMRRTTSAALASVLAVAVTGAFAARAHADLKLCNATPSRIGVAIGYQKPTGWTTEGWWNISAKTCETLLKGKVPSRYIYVYAIDYERGGEWAGPTMMCTSEASFAIDGVESCEQRGYQRSGFYEIDTGNENDWTIKLTDPEPEKGANQSAQADN